MPGHDHEAIIDSFRIALVGAHPRSLRHRYPHLDGPHGFHGAIGGAAASAVLGLDLDLRADAYVSPGDGFGPILVEIGSMRKGKWDDIVSASDDRPIRVLRISFDLGVSLMNRRHTQFEADMTEAVERQLHELLGAGDIGPD